MQNTVYASPAGTGTACTQTLPCSLAAAQVLVRTLNVNQTADIVVSLAGGIYRLTQPLSLTPADSASHGYNVVYQGASASTVVFSGAIQVTGWTRSPDNAAIWEAAVAPGTKSRNLFVNGVRATRTLGQFPGTLSPVSGGYQASDMTIDTWRNPSEIQLNFEIANWTRESCNIASITSGRITVQQPCWNNMTSRPHYQTPAAMSASSLPVSVENVFELLDQPGQFYLDDRAGKLYYIPRPDQDMSAADVELPILQQLVTGSGSLANPIHNIELNNIQFAETTWLAPDAPAGHPEFLLGYYFDADGQPGAEGMCTLSGGTNCSYQYMQGTAPTAAVSFSAANHIQIRGNTFSRLGGSALDLEYGAQDNIITGNTIADVSANGIQLGASNDPTPAAIGAGSSEITTGNTISDNYIRDIGAQYVSSAAIVALYVQNTNITHNDVEDLPYLGIAVGWGQLTGTLGPAITTIMQSDVVSNNLIHDIMQQVVDGGGIYFESPQSLTSSFADGARVTGNVIFNVYNGYFALYPDAGSQWITFSGNALVNDQIDFGGCFPIGDLQFVNNYWSGTYAFRCNTPINVTISGNALISTFSQIPANLLADAGLESAYANLLPSAAAPVVNSVTPRDATPGTTVTIAGSNLLGATAISFDGILATSFRNIPGIDPGAALSTVVPAGGSGKDAVVTTLRGGSSALLP
jgi:Right handed beta helix region